MGAQKMTANGAKDILAANRIASPENNSIHQLRAVAGLCNSGQFDAATRDRPLYERVVHGDATDQAILRFSEDLGPVSELRTCWQTKYQLAFNSKNKYMIQAFALARADGLALTMSADDAATFQPGDM